MTQKAPCDCRTTYLQAQVAAEHHLISWESCCYTGSVTPCQVHHTWLSPSHPHPMSTMTAANVHRHLAYTNDGPGNSETLLTPPAVSAGAARPQRIACSPECCLGSTPSMRCSVACGLKGQCCVGGGDVQRGTRPVGARHHHWQRLADVLRQRSHEALRAQRLPRNACG
jgi:hypothetical protein